MFLKELSFVLQKAFKINYKLSFRASLLILILFNDVINFARKLEVQFMKNREMQMFRQGNITIHIEFEPIYA